MAQICKFRNRTPPLNDTSPLLRWPRALGGDVRSNASRPLPDLEGVLEARYGAAAPVISDLAAFGDAVEGTHTFLDLEESGVTDQDEVWLALRTRGRSCEVRPGDVFVGGALFTGDIAKGSWEVRCRPVRLVCTNGQLMPLSDSLGTPAYERRPDGTAEGSIDEVVEAAFSGRVIEVTREMLQRTLLTPAMDGAMALTMLGMDPEELPASIPRWVSGTFLEPLDKGEVRKLLGGRDDRVDRDDHVDRPPRPPRDATPPEPVEEAPALEEPTVYGALNQITALAREAPSIRHRLQLEKLAGRMIERACGLPSFDLQPV